MTRFSDDPISNICLIVQPFPCPYNYPAMAASTISAPVTSRRRLGRLIFRIVLIVLALAVLALVGFAGWYYYIARASLPQLDGQVAVAGLTSPVSIVRDAHGVPHITASSLDDLFFVQGYVIAQDRLWQIDMTRRFAG